MKNKKLQNLNTIELSDCYTKSSDLALMNGVQALVRLLLEQSRIDKEKGFKTQGYVSGYPGSPLGTLDLELNRAKKYLNDEGIVFQPGVNEELAATAAWGTQMIQLYDQPKIDGVFSLWYGKGPGLDRAMDAIRHANMGGSSKLGGMLLAVADDPIGKSSTLAYQSEQSLISAGIPIFYPANVHEVVPLGLQAYQLSRYAGICVGLKITADTADSSAVVDLTSLRPKFKNLLNIENVHIQKHESALDREETLFTKRLPASKNFIFQNKINKIIRNPKDKNLGIIAVGKACTETIDALESIGIIDPEKNGIGIFSCKVPWPLNGEEIKNFINGYKEIFVIEEKRAVVEEQVAHILYNHDQKPILSGKFDGKTQEKLIPEIAELSSDIIADALIKKINLDNNISLKKVVKNELIGDNLPSVATRSPWYCAGCPHNSGTKMMDDEIVGIGIGCHSIGYFLHPDKLTNFSQMGGEGGHWIGRSPFSTKKHSFQNIGDGTYAHSGSLAIRAAVSAGTNITFKILYNDAVAMTGGQSAIGGGTPWNISKQLTAEGVKKVFVISDEPEQFSELKLFADGVTIAHRDEMIPIQKQLREIEGVTAIIYVQTCATELRRRRKRGYVEDRERKIFVNPDVCEGCGDCAEKSNCVGVKPLKHFDGEKKQIDQSICNKDYSCIKGFCPSFISIPQNEIFTENKKSYPALPILKKYFHEPNVLNKDINLVMAGIGGTGVSTVSAIIVMACRIENKWAQTMNFTGLAQKNGAVTSQIRISSRKNLYEKSARLPNKSADLLLGCDAVVSVSPLITRTLNLNKTKAVINGRVEPVGVSGVYTGTTVDDQLLKKHLENHLNSENIEFINMSDLAEKLVGDTVSANIMLLGYASQKGFLPISNHALEKAIKLNGVSIQQNLDAFNWGRLLVSNRSLVFKKAGLLVEKLSDDDPKVKIKKFHNILSDYQDDKYAKKYLETIEKLYAKEKLLFKNKFDFSLTKNSALMLFRFMRYKDEYEVARLHTSGEFANSFLNKNMKKNINFYLAPPLLNIRDKNTGHLKKIKFGSWMFYVFKLLSKLKFLRGTKFDFFGQTNERKKEVALAEKSLLTIDTIIKNISRTNYNICEDLINAALNIKGYGHVKEKNIKIYEEKWNSFLRKIDLHSVKKVS